MMQFDFEQYSYLNFTMHHPLLGTVLYMDDMGTTSYTIAHVVESINKDFVVVEYFNVMMPEQLIMVGVSFDDEKRYAWIKFDHEKQKWCVGHIAYELYPDLLEYYKEIDQDQYNKLMTKILGSKAGNGVNIT